MPDNTEINVFLERVNEHRNIVHKVCFLYGRNSQDREDLNQEIMLQLWKSYHHFAQRSSFSTWMYRVALNTAISYKRKHKAAYHLAETDLPAMNKLGPHPDDLRDLYRAVARLTDLEKAIIMQWLDERSYEQIGDTLGMTVKNVSVRLVRIKEKLATMLKEHDPS